MIALGTWVAFSKLESNYTNDDLMHGKVISVGELVKLPIKEGKNIVVSTVKKVQDIEEGKTVFYVQESQIISII